MTLRSCSTLIAAVFGIDQGLCLTGQLYRRADALLPMLP